MAKSTKKTVSILDLVVDTNTNVRLVNNYDIPAMKQAILDAGRIIDPIHVRASDNVVLRGNRRTMAGQELLNDPSTPQEVAKSLEKVEVVFHDVLPGSVEEMNVILDHGSQKGLSKTEVLQTVWRLDKQFMSEQQIINLLYMALAQYTNNPKKAAEAAAISEPRARNDYLRKWLHGTVGNYMLAAAKMGDYVREQMVLTHLSDDRLLPADKKVEIRMSRDRVQQLSQAKSKDDPKNGGEGWSPAEGGKHFNAALEQLRAEDRGEVDADKNKRPSAKELRERADVFKSPAIRSALLVAAGEQEHGKALVDLDDRLSRLSMVMETLNKAAPKISDPNVRALINAILGDGPAAEVELALRPFVS